MWMVSWTSGGLGHSVQIERVQKRFNTLICIVLFYYQAYCQMKTLSFGPLICVFSFIILKIILVKAELAKALLFFFLSIKYLFLGRCKIVTNLNQNFTVVMWWKEPICIHLSSSFEYETWELLGRERILKSRWSCVSLRVSRGWQGYFSNLNCSARPGPSCFHSG